VSTGHFVLIPARKVLYGNTDVETNSLILQLNSRPTMLLGRMSYVFIVGSNAGQALTCLFLSVSWVPTPLAGFPLSPVSSRSCVPSRFNRSLTTVIRKQSPRSQICLHVSTFLQYTEAGRQKWVCRYKEMLPLVILSTRAIGSSVILRTIGVN
jgi:hypothetical protein